MTRRWGLGRRTASSRRGRRRDERGSAAIFLVMLSVVLFVAAGLVIDGGLAINARMRVADDAEQASRAGANAIDLTRLRSEGGEIVIDPTLARAEAADYLGDLGYGGDQFSVSVDGDMVQVRITDSVRTGMLGLVGIHRMRVSASADSVPTTGE